MKKLIHILFLFVSLGLSAQSIGDTRVGRNGQPQKFDGRRWQVNWDLLLQSGESAKSAYDLAVENGFNGTVTEWLESLKGEDGADGLGANTSNTGSEITNVELKYRAGLIPKKNMFDKSTATQGKRRLKDGTLTNSSSRYISEQIPVTPNTQYYNNEVAEFIHFYNSNLELFPEADNLQGSIRGFTTPANAYYVEFTGYVSAIDTQQLELGSDGTDYEAFQLLVDNDQLSVKKTAIEFNEKIQLNELEGVVDFYEKDQNIFRNDPSFYVDDKRINSAGQLPNSDNTSRISVVNFPLPLYVEHVFFNSVDIFAFLDANKDIIGSTYSSVGSDFVIEKPENARFLSYSVLKSSQSDFMAAFSGDTEVYKPYEEPKRTIDNFAIPEGGADHFPFEVNISDTIFAQVGRAQRIYNYSLIPVNDYKSYSYDYESSNTGIKDVSFDRGYEIDDDRPGTSDLKITVRDDYNKIVAQKTVHLIIHDNTPTAEVLFIGDSWTNGKTWIPYIQNNTNLTSVGTRTSNAGDPDEYFHEGRSGTATKYYLSPTDTHGDPSEGQTGNDGRAGNLSPFVNPATGQADFNYYLNNYNKSASKIAILLGVNNLSRIDSEAIPNMISFVNQLNATGASTREIYIMHFPFKGTQTDGSVNAYGDKLRLTKLAKGYRDGLKDVANITFVPINAHFDSEFNYLSSQTRLANPYTTVTIPKAQEVIHASFYNELANGAIPYLQRP